MSSAEHTKGQAPATQTRKMLVRLAQRKRSPNKSHDIALVLAVGKPDAV